MGGPFRFDRTIALRCVLIAVALWWWVVLVGVCWIDRTGGAPNGRMVPFNCGTSVVLITPLENTLLYGLVGACLALAERWGLRPAPRL